MGEMITKISISTGASATLGTRYEFSRQGNSMIAQLSIPLLCARKVHERCAILAEKEARIDSLSSLEDALAPNCLVNRAQKIMISVLASLLEPYFSQDIAHARLRCIYLARGISFLHA